MEKEVHLRIDKNDMEMSLKQLSEKIREIQEQNPDKEVFFDGDEYAICSRPKKKV